MAPHANSKSLSSTALSSLLDRRAAASNPVPSKLVRRRDRNLRRRSRVVKPNGKDDDNVELDMEEDPKHNQQETSKQKRNACAVAASGTVVTVNQLEKGPKKRQMVEERVMVLKRMRRVSKEEREVRKRIMDLRSGKTRHVPKKKPQGFADDSDDDDNF